MRLAPDAERCWIPVLRGARPPRLPLTTAFSSEDDSEPTDAFSRSAQRHLILKPLKRLGLTFWMSLMSRTSSFFAIFTSIFSACSSVSFAAESTVTGSTDSRLWRWHTSSSQIAFN
ncbi:unnamed protein product [Prorocentrum cordatum]|uniref:Uncharacterized protein n=1 Tax=Prorocentrum cordatum TaxID=2364126 RepID=A0ABN9UL51_9DINO|nr:unnamed protein product [Polarella glacialis]